MWKTPGLESSEQNIAVLPSSASWFWSSLEKNKGCSVEGKQKVRIHALLKDNWKDKKKNND